MDQKKILSAVDHTLLTVTATWEEICRILDQGEKWETASVCIPPSYVRQAKERKGDSVRICTVIGFPNGYQTTASKVFETKDALNNGADEIDMVVNLGWVKDGLFEQVEEEIRELKKACGDHTLKVIVEACLLSESEKIALCRAVTRAGADFIKTSTGFSRGGATCEDVRLFAEQIGEGVQIKAAGGISSFEDAKALMECGASRLGTSRLVKLAEQK
ncbi:MAG: deoxyribose-phosphate aldolase [Clostridiales bacterium]|nr:deoxyribose-phosphate aldolase [Clostridiales bacterium]